MKAPATVQHKMYFDFELTNTQLIAEGKVFRCVHCQKWGDEEFPQDVCPQRERRRAERRRIDRRGGLTLEI